MGCDIHLVLERKVDDRWIAVDTFKGHESALGRGYQWPAATARNYGRFAKLANVRGDGPAPRGLPEQLSETAAFLVKKWGEDGHSHSWLPLKDAAAAFLETDRHDPDGFREKYPHSYYFGVDCDEVDQHRLVFWFDN